MVRSGLVDRERLGAVHAVALRLGVDGLRGSVYGDEEDVDGALLLITDNDLRIQIQEQNVEAYSFAAANLSFSDRVTALKVHRLVHNSQ